MMNWTHLQKCLQEYSMYLLKASQDNMPTYYELRNKINFVMNVNGNFYEIEFNAPSYWGYTENGRKPGKIPPINVISNWIKRRNIVPYAMKNGKLPTLDQLSYAIARKIGRDGVEGIHFLEKSLEEQKQYWEDQISEAISKDIIAELDSWFSNPIWNVK